MEKIRSAIQDNVWAVLLATALFLIAPAYAETASEALQKEIDQLRQKREEHYQERQQWLNDNEVAPRRKRVFNCVRGPNGDTMDCFLH